MIRSAGLIAVALALGLLPSRFAAAQPEAVAAQQAAIIGGEPSGPEDDAVVWIRAPAPPLAGRLCHGALIAPNVVVTPLSCVSYFTEAAPFQCTPEGALAPPDLGSGWIGETLDSDQIEVFFGPTFENGVRASAVFGSGSTQVCVDNIAFVVLERALPSRGFPVRLGRPIGMDETMTVIGSGMSGTESSGRFRRSNVPVLAVGPDSTREGPGSTAPRTFLLGEGPCGGDGGSPALSDETGALTGIFSLSLFGPADCRGGVATYVQIAPYESLLRRALRAAGAEPWLEGEARATDDSSSGCSFHGREESPSHALLGLVAMATLVRRRRTRER